MKPFPNGRGEPADSMVEDFIGSGNVLASPRLTHAKDIQWLIENAYKGIL